MKKRILVILGIFIIILLFVVYLLYNYNRVAKQAQSFNNKYEQYYQKTILGVDLATILNTTDDYNYKNNIEKDSNEKYYVETENSVLIQVKFLEKDESVKMEDILSQDIKNFVKYYGSLEFKCTNIEYHKENEQVKSLYFEQI